MSFQETVIRNLSERALGSRYVFCPGEYRKGSATREPADLAWHCRDTVVLMYMTDTNRGWKEDAAHNLRQAKGWLRVWRAGRPLVGKNDARDFSVPFDTNLAIVVLSITADTSLGGIELHDDDAKKLSLDSCATVSNGLMNQFADRGGSITDLAALLRLWPKLRSDARLSATTARDGLEYLRHYSVAEAGRHVGWSTTQPSEDLDLATRYVRGMRGVAIQGEDPSGADLFADFSFTEQFTLLFTLGRAAELVRRGTPSVVSPFEIERCRGRVIVAESSKWLSSLPEPPRDVEFEYVFELHLGLTLIAYRSLRTPTRAWNTLRVGFPRQSEAAP